MTINKNVLTVVAEYPLRDDKETTLIRIEFDKNTMISDVFKQIDSEMQVYLLSRYYEGYDLGKYVDRCPYIHAKGTVLWNVPYQDIKVIDFLRTHGISNNTILVEVDCLACDGGDLLDWALQSWVYITIVLDYLGCVLEVKEVFQIIFNTFGKRKKKIPSFDNIEQYLLNESCWDLKVLIKETRIPRTILVPILNAIGFEEHEGKYYKDEWKALKYRRVKEQIEYENYIANYSDLKEDVNPEWQETIATSLITLRELSDMVDKQKTYITVLSKLKEMLEKKEGDYCYDEEFEMIIKEIEKLECKLEIE